MNSSAHIVEIDESNAQQLLIEESMARPVVEGKPTPDVVARARARPPPTHTHTRAHARAPPRSLSG